MIPPCEFVDGLERLLHSFDWIDSTSLGLIISCFFENDRDNVELSNFEFSCFFLLFPGCFKVWQAPSGDDDPLDGLIDCLVLFVPVALVFGLLDTQ